MTPPPKPANTNPAPSSPPAQTGSAGNEDEPPDPFPSFTPSKLSSLSTKTPDKSLERTQFLRHSMTKRLSCVDRGWLERCQVFAEARDEHKPVAGNSDQPEKAFAQSTCRSDKAVVENGKARDSASPQDTRRGQVHVQKFPVDVDRGSGTADGEMETDQVPERQDGTDESKPSLETERQTKKPRSRKGRDSENSVTVRKKARKRQRDAEEGEERAGQTESVQKKRRTRNEDSAEEKPVRKGRKRKGTGAEEGGSTPQTEVPQKSKMPQENLLGEVDEEDVRAASSRKKNPARSR